MRQLLYVPEGKLKSRKSCTNSTVPDLEVRSPAALRLNQTRLRGILVHQPANDAIQQVMVLVASRRASLQNVYMIQCLNHSAAVHQDDQASNLPPRGHSSTPA